MLNVPVNHYEYPSKLRKCNEKCNGIHIFHNNIISFIANE